MTNAELDVIGSMLIDDECIDDIMEKLKEDDFSDEMGKSIFRAIADAWLSNGAVDAVLIAEKCENKDTAVRLMREAMELVTTTANAMEYAAVVKADSVQRKAMLVADKIAMGYPIADCVLELEEVANGREDRTLEGGDGWREKFSERLAANMADPDSAFCKTGYAEFDEMLGGGMVKGGLYILGARPGMGKTTFAINIAEKIAKRGQKVLFVSLEMSPHQIMCKRLSLDSDVPYKRILYGKINSYEKEQVDKSLDVMIARPFFTNNGFSLTVADIASLAKKCKGCECLVIDYFGLISAPDAVGSRYEIYSDISRKLKQLAGTLDIPILCLAQLNREVDKNNGSTKKKKETRKPNLSDLRDTGSLEQDADAVVFLHRDEYYGVEDADGTEMFIIVRKNRHGDSGEIKMQWFGQTGQIVSFDNTHNERGELEF